MPTPKYFPASVFPKDYGNAPITTNSPNGAYVDAYHQGTKGVPYQIDVVKPMPNVEGYAPATYNIPPAAPAGAMGRAVDQLQQYAPIEALFSRSGGFLGNGVTVNSSHDAPSFFTQVGRAMAQVPIYENHQMW